MRLENKVSHTVESVDQTTGRNCFNDLINKMSKEKEQRTWT